MAKKKPRALVGRRANRLMRGRLFDRRLVDWDAIAGTSTRMVRSIKVKAMVLHHLRVLCV
jgi:hypothetical protein